jgi:hypothetical protein
MGEAIWHTAAHREALRGKLPGQDSNLDKENQNLSDASPTSGTGNDRTSVLALVDAAAGR